MKILIAVLIVAVIGLAIVLVLTAGGDSVLGQGVKEAVATPTPALSWDDVSQLPQSITEHNQLLGNYTVTVHCSYQNLGRDRIVKTNATITQGAAVITGTPQEKLILRGQTVTFDFTLDPTWNALQYRCQLISQRESS